ncbi:MULTISPECIES: hypothetical protein [unclassified Streptomyces]|uniref:hypothetical protein n=1 Tax=unclassified Streptomyces TaxID=2593676 RepID=UPI002251292B|nr:MULTISPECIES: hypothetical protein [unclassified Streptomyces]MCX4527024.1 hypothetical protein [Streptomyces sp. NBC_01551]MCX4542416.1 hypothetical protein [Streptomyces sp. NBC_01565]
MRLPKALTTAATAVVALTALTGCGSDAKDDGLGLPSAGDLASVEKFVNQHAQCNNLRTKKAEGTEGILTDEAKDPAWAIKERGVCNDADGDIVTLLAISDMAKFQAANHKAAQDGKVVNVLAGKDFAVVAVGGDSGKKLMDAGLLLLTCASNYEIPSGYKKHGGLVEGCVLTDYRRS